MKLSICLSAVVIASCVAIPSSGHADPVPASAASPFQQASDPVMGDWQGEWGSAGAARQPLCAQVIALGNGAYQANLLPAFDQRVPALAVLMGKTADGAVRFEGMSGGKRWAGAIQADVFKGEVGESGTFELKKVTRLSPTLGEKPPAGAVVLFDGTNLDAWEHPGQAGQPCRWLLLDTGVMEVRDGNVISKQHFTDQKVHVEFRTPFVPDKRGQDRGNSGVYLQGRYEVQVLDSYGLEGADNECGGVYKVAPPRVNMCAPPLQWQTYDITFTAPRFDAAGQKTADARMTVLHNGVLIHENLAVPGPTTAALDQNVTEPGGLHLQDHGNPVEYRNVWVVEQ